MSESKNRHRMALRILKSQNNSLEDLQSLAKDKYDLKIAKNDLVIMAISLLLKKVNANDSEFDSLLKEFFYI